MRLVTSVIETQGNQKNRVIGKSGHQVIGEPETLTADQRGMIVDSGKPKTSPLINTDDTDRDREIGASENRDIGKPKALTADRRG
jgi:hypothetical protein